MGELTKASNALQNEIVDARRKLVLLQGANKHLQRLMADYNKKVSVILNEVKSDPQFADKKAKMDEIDRRTDPHWEKLDTHRGKTVLLARDWVNVSKTLPKALDKVVAVLMRYDTKGKDTKAKKAADARKAVDKGVALLKIVTSDIKNFEYLYSEKP